MILVVLCIAYVTVSHQQTCDVKYPINSIFPALVNFNSQLVPEVFNLNIDPLVKGNDVQYSVQSDTPNLFSIVDKVNLVQEGSPFTQPGTPQFFARINPNTQEWTGDLIALSQKIESNNINAISLQFFEFTELSAPIATQQFNLNSNGTVLMFCTSATWAFGHNAIVDCYMTDTTGAVGTNTFFIAIPGVQTLFPVPNNYTASVPNPNRQLIFFQNPNTNQGLLIRATLGQSGFLEFFSFINNGLGVFPEGNANKTIALDTSLLEVTLQANGTLWLLLGNHSLITITFDFQQQTLITSVLPFTDVNSFTLVQNTKLTLTPILNLIYQSGNAIFEVTVLPGNPQTLTSQELLFPNADITGPFSIFANPNFILISCSQCSGFASFYYTRGIEFNTFFQPTGTYPFSLNGPTNQMLALVNRGNHWTIDLNQIVGTTFLQAQATSNTSLMTGSLTLTATTRNQGQCTIPMNYTIIKLTPMVLEQFQTTMSQSALPTTAVSPIPTNFQLKYMFSGNLLQFATTYESSTLSAQNNVSVSVSTLQPISGSVAALADSTATHMSINPLTQEILLFTSVSTSVKVYLCLPQMTNCKLLGTVTNFPTNASQIQVVYPAQALTFYALFAFYVPSSNRIQLKKIVLQNGIIGVNLVFANIDVPVNSSNQFQNFFVLGQVIYIVMTQPVIMVMQVQQTGVVQAMNIDYHLLTTRIPGILFNSNLLVTGDFFRFGQTLFVATSQQLTKVYVMAILDGDVMYLSQFTSSFQQATLLNLQTAGGFLFLNFGTFVEEFDLRTVQVPQYSKTFFPPNSETSFSLSDWNFFYTVNNEQVSVFVPGEPLASHLIYQFQAASLSAAPRLNDSIVIINSTFFQAARELILTIKPNLSANVLTSNAKVEDQVSQTGSYSIVASQAGPPATSNQTSMLTSQNSFTGIAINASNTPITVKKQKFSLTFAPSKQLNFKPPSFTQGSVIDFLIECFPFSQVVSQLAATNLTFAVPQFQGVVSWAGVVGILNNYQVSTLAGSLTLLDSLTVGQPYTCSIQSTFLTSMLVACNQQSDATSPQMVYIIAQSDALQPVAIPNNLITLQASLQQQFFVTLSLNTSNSIQSLFLFTPTSSNPMTSLNCPNSNVISFALQSLSNNQFIIYFGCEGNQQLQYQQFTFAGGDFTAGTTSGSVTLSSRFQANTQLQTLFLNGSLLFVITSNTFSLAVETDSVTSGKPVTIQYVIPPYGSFQTYSNPNFYQVVGNLLTISYTNGKYQVIAVYPIPPPTNDTQVLIIQGGHRFSPATTTYALLPNLTMLANTSSSILKSFTYSPNITLNLTVQPDFEAQFVTFVAQNDFVSVQQDLALKNGIVIPLPIPKHLEWWAWLLLVINVIVFGASLLYGGIKCYRIREQEKKDVLLMNKHAQVRIVVNDTKSKSIQMG